MPHPVLETPRLTLRPLRAGDEPSFLALAGDWEVARMTSDIPYPLMPSHAKDWLQPLEGDRRFAIELAGQMVGCVGYFQRRSGAAELGFWLGRHHWGFGFATEAAAAVVRHGFCADGQSCFSSAHFADNPASGRVLGKLGFAEAGRSRMWCSARGIEVDAVGFWLSRERAEVILGPLPDRHDFKASSTGRFGRWFDQARKALKDQAQT